MSGSWIQHLERLWSVCLINFQFDYSAVFCEDISLVLPDTLQKLQILPEYSTSCRIMFNYWRKLDIHYEGGDGNFLTWDRPHDPSSKSSEWKPPDNDCEDSTFVHKLWRSILFSIRICLYSKFEYTKMLPEIAFLFILFCIFPNNSSQHIFSLEFERNPRVHSSLYLEMLYLKIDCCSFILRKVRKTLWKALGN